VIFVEYTVNGSFSRPGGLNFGAVGVEEVLQNVRTLLATKKFSVPLDRDVGLDFSVLDKPYPRAQAEIRTEIIQALRRFEPRARVIRVAFDGDPLDGALNPSVTVRIDV
jgi:phage baseplate assembly protein W